MRARTPKRAAQERVYRKRAAEFLDANPACSWPLGCGHAASEVHHRRGRRGTLLLLDEFWSGLCSDHHRFATEHPARAYELGISERRIGAA